MKKKALIVSSYPAPYRVGVFKLLSNEYDIDLYFDSNENENRNSDWFVKIDENFFFQILDNAESKSNFKNALKNITKYDFLIAYDPARKPAIKAINRAIRKKIPYFVNNDGAFIKKNFLKDLIKKYLFKNASACFSSGKSANKYFQYYGVKKERIFNHKFSSLFKEDILDRIITEDEKKKNKKMLGLSDAPVVLTIGQFIPRKGFDVLLEAWSKCINNGQLVIIGGGEEKENYYNIIKKYNIKNVIILDFMNKKELAKYYQASDIFVLPTREDVWGLVINEAMAFGLPIISTNKCNAAVELIENNINGFIVDVEDINSLKEKIDLLLHNKKMCNLISKNNLEKIKEYTIENIAISHIEVINKILK